MSIHREVVLMLFSIDSRDAARGRCVRNAQGHAALRRAVSLPSKETACSAAGPGLAAGAARFDSRKAIETISIIYVSVMTHLRTASPDEAPVRRALDAIEPLHADLG